MDNQEVMSVRCDEMVVCWGFKEPHMRSVRFAVPRARNPKRIEIASTVWRKCVFIRICASTVLLMYQSDTANRSFTHCLELINHNTCFCSEQA